jgi:hypothetical protein
MFKRPLLSNLVYTKRQIVIHAFTTKHVHPGKFLPTDLSKINYDGHLPIMIDGKKIGRFQVAIHHRDQNSIYLYFENTAPNLNLDNHWASFEVIPKVVQCPVCKAFFNRNESPCECIKGAPFYYLPEFTTKSVQLHDYKKDNEDSYDCRNDLYSEFFNRSLHNLTFLEPI